MLMPGRRFTTSTYRYGFNGKENDNDIKGEGNEQDYGMRIYDSRIGKFLSVDPLTKSFPWYSPFQFAGNAPIVKIDLDGNEPKDFKNNWVPKSMFVLNTKQEVGNEMLIIDPILGKAIDVSMIYDNWTKKIWFIHRDDQGNWLYLRNNNGEHSEMSIDPKTNTLKGGTFVPFKTQDQIQAKYMRDLADGTGLVFAGIVATISGGMAVDGLCATYGTSAVSEAVINEVKDEIIDQAKESVGIPSINIKDVKSVLSFNPVKLKKELSPNVEKFIESIKDFKSKGGKIKINPLKPNQEINMTFQFEKEKLDFRIETHPLPKKYGGDGVTPQRHMNVDLYPNKNDLPYNGHKKLE